jgi:hypothetical protein
MHARCPTFREKRKNIILLLRTSSHLIHHYALPIGGNRKATCGSYKKSYLSELPIRSIVKLPAELPAVTELCEELPIGAT